MMQWRNPTRLPDGGIDCEVNHPGYGWIPSTVRADDPATAVIHTEIEAAGSIPDSQRFVTPEMVKAEARRRILAIAPDWKQRNHTAEGVELLIQAVQGQDWTDEQRAKVATVLNDVWGPIKAIRARSNEIEGMDPIPADFDSDEWWA